MFRIFLSLVLSSVCLLAYGDEVPIEDAAQYVRVWDYEKFDEWAKQEILAKRLPWPKTSRNGKVREQTEKEVREGSFVGIYAAEAIYVNSGWADANKAAVLVPFDIYQRYRNVGRVVVVKTQPFFKWVHQRAIDGKVKLPEFAEIREGKIYHRETGRRLTDYWVATLLGCDGNVGTKENGFQMSMNVPEELFKEFEKETSSD